MNVVMVINYFYSRRKNTHTYEFEVWQSDWTEMLDAWEKDGGEQVILAPCCMRPGIVSENQ